MEYLELGATPAGEDCVQVGDPDYHSKALPECRRYKAQLERQFPVPDLLKGLVYFSVKAFPHDFGTYHEVIVKYDERNESACNFAYSVENELPEHWQD